MKLKPCPFCGGEAASDSEVELGTVYTYVYCTSCMARTDGRLKDYSSEAEIALDWNKRANTDEDEELIIVNDITLNS